MKTPWKGYESFQRVVLDISRFIPVAASYTGMLIGGIDFIMLLSDWLAERRENRIEAAKNEVRQEISNDLTAWNNRRAECPINSKLYYKS